MNVDGRLADSYAGSLGAQSAHVVGCADGVDAVLCHRVTGLDGVVQILAVLENDVAAYLVVRLPRQRLAADSHHRRLGQLGVVGGQPSIGTAQHVHDGEVLGLLGSNDGNILVGACRRVAAHGEVYLVAVLVHRTIFIEARGQVAHRGVAVVGGLYHHLGEQVVGGGIVLPGTAQSIVALVLHRGTAACLGTVDGAVAEHVATLGGAGGGLVYWAINEFATANMTGFDATVIAGLAAILSVGMFFINSVTASYNIGGTIEGFVDPKFKRLPTGILACAIVSLVAAIFMVLMIGGI